MVWQDVIITICVLAFSYALVPQIVHGFKNKKSSISAQTTFISSAGMIILGITYITLKLYFSAIMSIIGGMLWEILFIQNRIYK
ncbi:hypothetical protein HN935_00125 [archaeon]|jgi:hypothetical protein|nr:hypothetical protein [archaeon]